MKTRDHEDELLRAAKDGRYADVVRHACALLLGTRSAERWAGARVASCAAAQHVVAMERECRRDGD